MLALGHCTSIWQDQMKRILEVNLSRYHTVNVVFPQRQIGVERVLHTPNSRWQ